eukprot:CAMPEP_0198330132 /NCGR_PEP_ID=MMETSP1450-20131203/16702_1 /TAXON_ID=753684 ORGANISM="Madagascaria erythrocladiodes, Strain CCMP3234" /NCGR_SAMPLE_ID=MMETSP1450 /ASSEMBLY_ACC=CAM_ASM_001115 /LENGTH=98 /DNA_ID=CAMNT_0044034399 /DNA_START=1 /DNA_END=297 /DNA_ORIENTATION=+
MALSLSPSDLGEILCSASEDGTPRYWDLRTGESIAVSDVERPCCNGTDFAPVVDSPSSVLVATTHSHRGLAEEDSDDSFSAPSNRSDQLALWKASFTP